jgi:plasmid stabilization system protein ParE
MSRGIGFKPLARREFDKAKDWYERRESGLGARFESEVNSVLNRVKTSPEQFPQVQGVVRKARVLNFRPYNIYFIEGQDKIIVIAVHDGRRDPEKLKRRLR